MPSRRPIRARFMVALLLAAGLTLTVTILLYRPAVIYSDAGEYMKMGKLFSFEYRPTPVEVAQERIAKGGAALTGDHPTGRGDWKYPPGYPLLLSLPCYIWGPRGMFAVGPVLLFLTLMTLYLLCSRLTRGWISLLAIPLALLVPSVTMNFMWNTSHMLTSLLLLWGLILLDRWEKDGRTRDLVLCGLISGLIPLVRNPEIVLTIGLGMTVLIIAVRRGRRWPGRLAAFCTGALVPLVLLGIYNHLSYGSPFRTGYFHSGEQAAFSISFLRQNALPYLQLLVRECGAHIVLLAMAGMILMWRTPGRRTTALAIAICILPSFLLYMSYDWYADMRFLLPCLFLVVTAAVFLMSRLCRLAGRRYRTPVIAGVLGLAIVNSVPHFALTLPMWSREAELVRGAADLVISQCPQGSTVVTDWRICQDLDVTGNFVLFGQRELEQHLEAGIWKIAEISEDRTAFYLLGYPDLVEQVESLLPGRFRTVRLDTFQIWYPHEGAIIGVLPDQISPGMTDEAMLLLQGYPELVLVRIENR